MKPIRYRISRPSYTWIIDIEMATGDILTYEDIDWESLRNQVHSLWGFDIKSLNELAWNK